MKRIVSAAGDQRGHGQPADASNGKKVAGRVPVELRQERLMHAFQENGFISVIEMAEEIGVSTMTIRRDLGMLEQAGKITRIHGGAVAVRDGEAAAEPEESLFDRRLTVEAEAKAAIARVALGLVEPGQAVGLDTGTTVLTVALGLAARKGLRIVTNNLRAAMVLSGSENRVYMLGGEVRVPELSVAGAATIKALQTHFLDVALIGVSALDAEGIYDFSPEDTEVKRAMMEGAALVVVLCDASKFGRRALARVGELASFHVLVTDRAPPPDLAAALAAAGVAVHVAEAPLGERSDAA